MTVRRRLKAVMLYGRIARRKPFESTASRLVKSWLTGQQHSDDRVTSTISRRQPDRKFVEQGGMGHQEVQAGHTTGRLDYQGVLGSRYTIDLPEARGQHSSPLRCSQKSSGLLDEGLK